MKQAKRREEDLVVGYSNEGVEYPVYHPVILKLVIIGAILLGGVFGVIGYLVAEGTWAIVDYGHFSAAFTGTAAITAAGVGVALGALIGGLAGLHRMLKYPKRRDVY